MNEIVGDNTHEGIFKLKSLNAGGGKSIIPFANVEIEINGKAVYGSGFGNGPINATFNVIAELTESKAELMKFFLESFGTGTDVPGKVKVKLKENGFVTLGVATGPDIITASAEAYINGLNRLEYLKANPKQNVGS